MARYELRDDGYSTFQKITRDKKQIGRVTKNADGSYIGSIGNVQIPGSSREDAMNRVVAEVEGIPVHKLNHELIVIPKLQESTRAILIWLANHAESNDGHLHFTNDDLARVAGWAKSTQRRPLGEIINRLDFCCCKIGLPSIGCAAEKPFARAWQNNGKGHYLYDDFEYPVELMQRRAKSHRWTRADFERLQRESLALPTGSASKVWADYWVKHGAKIKEWAAT